MKKSNEKELKIVKSKAKTRNDDELENPTKLNEIFKKMNSFLLTICKGDLKINPNERLILTKIFDYLKNYEIENPIYFLRSTNLGILIKYISINCNDKEIKREATFLFEYLQNKVLTQLFQ